MLYRSVPCCLSPSQRSFPQAICPACCLAPSQRSSPQAISTVSYPSCCLVPSQRSSPQAICTVSSPSSMLSRSLSEALRKQLHGFLSVQHAVSLRPTEALRKPFPRFPLRPACWLASSRRSSPQAISTVSSPSSMLSRSLPAKLSASYFHGFLSVQHAVSLPPSEALRKLFARFRNQHAVSLPPSESLRKLFPPFPVCPACYLAPSQRSCPRAISTVSYPSSMLARSLPAKLSAMLFARLPFRPACCLATACNARCFIFNVYSKSAKEQLAITSFCLDLRASMNTCGFHM